MDKTFSKLNIGGEVFSVRDANLENRLTESDMNWLASSPKKIFLKWEDGYYTSQGLVSTNSLGKRLGYHDPRLFDVTELVANQTLNVPAGYVLGICYYNEDGSFAVKSTPSTFKMNYNYRYAKFCITKALAEDGNMVAFDLTPELNNIFVTVFNGNKVDYLIAGYLNNFALGGFVNIFVNWERGYISTTDGTNIDDTAFTCSSVRSTKFYQTEKIYSLYNMNSGSKIIAYYYDSGFRFVKSVTHTGLVVSFDKTYPYVKLAFRMQGNTAFQFTNEHMENLQLLSSNKILTRSDVISILGDNTITNEQIDEKIANAVFAAGSITKEEAKTALGDGSRTVPGMVTFVTDDAMAEDYTLFKPIFDRAGIGCTTAVVPTRVGQENYATLAQLKEMQDAGWEICSHAYHSHLPQLTDNALDAELAGSQNWLIENGFNGYDILMYPFGDYDERVKRFASKYYKFARTTQTGYAKFPLNTYETPCYYFSNSTSHWESTGFNANTIEHWSTLIDRAMAEGKWLIIFTHSWEVAEWGNSALFEQVVNYAAANANCVSCKEALNIIGNCVDQVAWGDEFDDHFVIAKNGQVGSNIAKTCVLKPDSVNFSTKPLAFKNGYTSVCAISANKGGAPGGVEGTLFTHCFAPAYNADNYSACVHQEYVVKTTGRKLMRQGNSANGWNTEWRYVGNVVATTEERDNANFYKYNGLIVYDSTLKKPVCYNGSYWADFTGGSANSSIFTNAGYNIVSLGDSIVGMPVNDKTTNHYIAEVTGANVSNCAFGGSRASNRGSELNAPFSLCALADAIATGNFTAQETAANTEGNTYYFDTRTETLKNVSFENVDILLLTYGTNDFTADVEIDDDSNRLNTSTYKGSLRYAIERILTAYPNLRICMVAPCYRYWLVDGDVSETSDTRKNGKNYLLHDYVDAMVEIGGEYHIPVVNPYDDMGICSKNHAAWFNEGDGTHPSNKGQKILAKLIAKTLIGM